MIGVIYIKNIYQYLLTKLEGNNFLEPRSGIEPETSSLPCLSSLFRRMFLAYSSRFSRVRP